MSHDPSGPTATASGPATKAAAVETFTVGTRSTVLHGDALAALTTMPDASVDSIVTDPPYGLSKEPDIVQVLTHWLAGDDYTHTGRGFMGNSWDSFVPGPSVWREAYRVLKPGGYGVVFASSRTSDLMGIALRMAGFEIRDTLHWQYASGFPKSANVAAALVKAGRADLAADHAGSGTALKPSHEPIILVRKPLTGTIARNVIDYGTGALNIDDCRVPHAEAAPDEAARDRIEGNGRAGEASSARRYNERGGTNFAPTPGPRGGAPEGRFPSNTLMTHSPDCGSDEEPLPCVPGCPVGILDAQSGILTSGKPGTYRGTPNRSAAYGAESRQAGQPMTGFGDSGGASRFYPTFRYNKKASPSERATVWVPTDDCVGAGHSPDPHHPDTSHSVASLVPATCDACGAAWVSYQHATVKPVHIMRWLARLVTPTEGTLLDLYAGTGTTGVAAENEAFASVLIERDGTHVAMIRNRMTPSDQPSLFGDQ